MVDLPHVFPGYIQQEETRFKAAVSEYTMQKFGQAINALIDSLNFKKDEFITPGAHTWLCPPTVTRVILQGIGGGGPGGSSGTPAVSGVGSGAGGGGAAQEFSMWYDVIPGTTYNLTVGAGGVSIFGTGTGTQGGDSIFDGVTLSKGGYGAQNHYYGYAGLSLNGGSGGFTAVPLAGRGGDALATNTVLQDGYPSWMDLVAGGLKSSPIGGGGGGASIYGAGGNGGTSGGGAGNAPGATAYGAGGGGAGANVLAAYLGGNGMNGKISIYYQN